MTDLPFDLAGPLPGPGLTVLEASAGTGKTHTLTSLAARYVADGHPLEEILAVTFTRAATGELRERTRQRIIAVAAGLRSARGGAGDGGDAVVGALSVGTADDIDLRVQRLDDAVAAFDAATIVTTHGFCQLVLDGLGTAGDVVSGTALLEDPTDLVDEVIDDLYLRQVIAGRASPGFAASQARRAVLRTVGDAALEVRPCGQGDTGSRLGQLADFARYEVTQRLARADQVTYDRLLSRLQATLGDAVRGPAACARLRDRWKVVLVDEFQDTDPVQWQILDAAFGGGSTTLVLVGDPKQAIYSFRGADVHAYLAARRQATARFTLATNWRSDAPLLAGLEGLLHPLQLGHPEIAFSGVAACPDHATAGLRSAAGAPVRIRVVDDHHPGITRTRGGGRHEKTSLTAFVAADVAADVARLLGTAPGTTPAEVRDASAPAGWRDVEPRDVAVLTRRNAQAVAVRDALRSAGVPAVVTGLDSVFATRAATEWLRLLDGLVEPSSRGAAAGVALGPWIGWSAERVASAPEADWDQLHATLHRWAATLAASGVAAVHHAITVQTDLPARELARSGGERLLTDLGHLAELLHARAAKAPSGRPGIAALRAWLAARMTTNEAVDVDERSRRLDSDAEAVTVSTVHAAKGLEWGVVYCPYLWDVMRSPNTTEPVVYHDGDRRVLDPGLFPGDAARPAREAARRSALQEARGEDLRLLYVGLTRARHQVVLTWGRGHDSRLSSLGRLLSCRDRASGELRPPPSDEPTQRKITDELARLAEAAPGCISVEEATGPGAGGGAGAGAAAGEALQAAAFERQLDGAWRRASYTSITAAAHGRPSIRVASEPEEPGTGDEPDVDPAPGAPVDGAVEGDVASPWVGLPAGAEVGTTVHRVLELVDFADPDLPGAVATALARVPGAAALAGLAPALGATLTTPLGPLFGGAALADVRRADRLDELSFELPVAGGTSPTGLVRTGAIAAVVGRHLDAAGPLVGYADRLADPLLAATFRGYLTGSLDLVVRRRVGGVDRYVVADYKTNRIVPAGHAATAGDYRAAVLDAEMQRQHYPLQALLYSVALHRYLRWRLAGYDPAVHLGGVAYLFVRGMVGPDTPVVDGGPCGVFPWRPPTALITDLDELLATGEPA